MDPRGSVAVVASGLSLALLAASLLPPVGRRPYRMSAQQARLSQSADSPPSRMWPEEPTTEPTARGRSGHCQRLYPPAFYHQALVTSGETLGRRCRPQLPTEQDCAAADAWLRSTSGPKSLCFGSECPENINPGGQTGTQMSFLPKVKVVECDAGSGGHACWEKLKRADDVSEGHVTRRCLLIYPSLLQPSDPFNLTSASPPSPDPIPPPVHNASNSPTPDPLHCAALPVPLAARRWVYAGGGAALSAALTSLRPLTFLNSPGAERSLLYLACSPGSLHGDVTQRLLLVNLRRSNSTWRGRRKARPYNIKVTLIPALSRAGFYRSFPRAVRVLQSLSQTQGGVFDFPLYQATAASSLSVSLTHFLSGLLHRRSDGGFPSGSAGLFISGLSTWEEDGTSERGSTRSGRAAGTSDEPQEEDAATDFRWLLEQVSPVDNFLCTAVREVGAASGWLRRPVPRGSTLAHDVTALHLALSGHMARHDLFPVSVSALRSITDLGNKSDPTDVGDALLASHIEHLGNSRAIHVIFSMVGTMSSPYARESSYTFVEQSNPLLLIAVPKAVQDFIPKRALHYLSLNTNRLVTSGDIALSIATLTSYAELAQNNVSVDALPVRGINGTVTFPLAFNEVALNRTCDSLGVGSPHFCICQDEWIPAENDTIYVALAEVAIATLNHVITEQVHRVNGRRLTSFSHSPYGSCLKIFGVGFYDIKVRRQGDVIQTAMSLIVTPKSAELKSHHSLDTFSVILETRLGTREIESQEQRTLLTDYQRTSAVDVYSACADTRVDLDLCLCVPGSRDFTYIPANLIRELNLHQFGTKARFVPLHQTCLLLSIRHFGQSVSFTGANLCSERTYRVSLTLFADHVITSRDNPSTAVIGPLRETSLNVVWKWSYHQPMGKIGYKVFYDVINDSSQ